jgi:hypothetical protein
LGWTGLIGKNHRDISVKYDVLIVSHEVIEIIRQCLGAICKKKYWLRRIKLT